MKNNIFNMIGRLITLITVMVIPTGIGYVFEEYADVNEATVGFTCVWVGLIAAIGLLKVLKSCLTK